MSSARAQSPESPSTDSTVDPYVIKPAADIDVTLRWGTNSSLTLTVSNTMDLNDFCEVVANQAEFPDATTDSVRLVLQYGSDWHDLIHGELRHLRVEHGSILQVWFEPRRCPCNKRAREE